MVSYEVETVLMKFKIKYKFTSSAPAVPHTHKEREELTRQVGEVR